MMSNAVPTANGHALIKHTKSVYGTINTVEAELIRYMKRILRFLQPEGQRPEQEKDVWDIAMLDIPINENPIYKTEKLDFRRIFQDGIREEVKQAIYLHLKYEKLGTVKLEMSSLRQFSKYLRDKHSGIQSCAEIDRALIPHTQGNQWRHRAGFSPARCCLPAYFIGYMACPITSPMVFAACLIISGVACV